MNIPFNLYDFLGYAFPGFVVIIIAVILINPDILTTPQSPIETWLGLIQKVTSPDATPTNQTEPAKSGLERSLPTSIFQMIFYVLACYLVGLAVHGFTDWLFAKLSKKWKPLKRYYSDQGTFERGLFDSSYREDPIDFVPYSDRFVGKLKTQIEKIFGVKVARIRREAGDQVADQKYMEIFEFCRSAVIERSPAHYSRAFVLLSLYNSARLLGGIFLLAAVGFLVRIFVPQQYFEWTWLAVYLILSLPWIWTKLLPWIWTKAKNWTKLLPWIWTKAKKSNDCAKKESEKSCTKVNCVKRDTNAIKITSILGPVYWAVGLLGTVAARLWIANHIPQNEAGGFKILFWGYCVSTALCPIFFYLYNLFRRYYRNSIIYGFYEYAVTREKETEKSNAT